MKRLTFDGLFCDIAKCDSTPGGTFCESGTCTQRRVWERLKEYENTGLEPEEIKNALDVNDIMPEINVTVDQLRNILQAERDGRLVVLPCKVGATVYGHSKAEVSEYEVAVISLATYNWYLRCQNHNSDFWVTDADIGKTVFLTREEAEAALAQEGGSNEQAGDH